MKKMKHQEGSYKMALFLIGGTLPLRQKCFQEGDLDG